jgi:hypothetical protein
MVYEPPMFIHAIQKCIWFYKSVSKRKEIGKMGSYLEAFAVLGSLHHVGSIEMELYLILDMLSDISVDEAW